MCITAELTNIQSLIKDIGEESVVILTSFKNQREFNLHYKMNLKSIGCQVFNAKWEGNSMPIEKENLPFMFVCDSSMVGRMVFLPSKYKVDSTFVYYQIIKTFISQRTHEKNK